MNPVAAQYGAPQLPQVDLTPKDVNDKKTMRVVQTLATLGVLGAVALGLIGFSAAYAVKSLAKANYETALADELVAVQERNERISVYDGYRAQEQEEIVLAQVGSGVMDWSNLLVSFAATANDKTSYDVVKIMTPSAAGIGGEALDPEWGGGVGQIQFTAYATSYEEATKLMERIEALPGVAKVRSTVQKYEEAPIYMDWQIEGTAIITDKWLTHALFPEGGLLEQGGWFYTWKVTNETGEETAPVTSDPTTEPTASATPEPTESGTGE